MCTLAVSGEDVTYLYLYDRIKLSYCIDIKLYRLARLIDRLLADIHRTLDIYYNCLYGTSDEYEIIKFSSYLK